VDQRSLLLGRGCIPFRAAPVIGIGARNFPDRNLVDPGMATHNVYLEVAAEIGVIGLLAFLFLLYRAFRIEFSHKKAGLPQELQYLRYALLCSSLAIVIESLTDNSFYVWQVWCLFWLIRVCRQLLPPGRRHSWGIMKLQQPKPERMDASRREVVVGGRWPRVAIVVLNWNGREVLEDCVRSIYALSYAPLEVVVVDNGSMDGSAEMVQNTFGDCILIQNEKNLGFAKGNNQGIEVALERGNDYVMTLNNDTLLDLESLSLLVQRAESDPRIAAVSPKIYFADPSDHLWFAGGTFSYWKGRNGHVGYRQKDCPAWNVPGEAQFISGCAPAGLQARHGNR